MTDKKDEALRLALDALEEPLAPTKRMKAITAIRAALASKSEALAEQPIQQRHISYVCPQCYWSLDEQPAQQQPPVAWTREDEEYGFCCTPHPLAPFQSRNWKWTPLYTTPPQCKPWAGLTNKDIYECEPKEDWYDTVDLARAIEAKLKEKNT